MTTTELHDFFYVTEDDQKANQEGRLSERQIAEFQRRRRSILLVSYALLIVPASIIWLGFNNVVIPLLVLLAGGTYITFFGGNKLRRDLEEKRVVTATGAIKLGTTEGLRVRHYVQIGQRQFEITRSLKEALQAGEIYMIYYALHTEIVFSIVPLENGQTRLTELS